MPDKTQANDVGIGVIGGALAYSVSSESNSPHRPESQQPEYIDFNDMYCPNPDCNYY